MRKWKTLSVPAIIGLILVAIVGVNLLFMYVAPFIPTKEQLCSRKCAETQQSGQLKYIDPWQLTAGMRGRGPSECKCR